MSKRTAIIIGSGVAGLALATRLAIQGFEVKVFERNSYPGGKLTMFEKDGYRFDAGPSLFTQPRNLHELFEAAGESIEDFFTYTPVDVACHYFFENGKKVTGYADPGKFAKEMEEQTGEPGKAVLKYLVDAKKLYANIGQIFLNFSLHKKSTWLHKRIGKALVSLKPSYLFSSLRKYNASKFRTPEGVQIFNRFATYNGSNPYKAPAMLSLIPHIEINEGVFYPGGGMISITNALVKLAEKKGVQFFFNTPVERIIHTENKVLGIVAGEENILADIVVSNADIYFTYKNLLGLHAKSKKQLKKERSSSALIFYWGMSTQFPLLGLHNTFFSKNYQQEFESIFHRKTIFNDPTVYINISCKEDPKDAPAGKENWFVMLNVPANHGQNWEQLISQARENILNKISRLLDTDVRSLIESESILDPVAIEQRTGSFMGALYGTSSNSRLAAFRRTPNFTGYIKNLYFCGGTVHPGGGIPLCLKSAAITAKIIEKDSRKSSLSTH